MKAKKILVGILSVLFFGFSSVALASCGEQPTEQPHVHEWDEGQIVNQATCTEAGLIAFTCKACDETKVDVISAKGHTEVIDEPVDPTCTETGLTEGKHCSDCGEVFVAQEAVEALGHTEVIDEAVEPTCTSTGLTKGKHCSTCNEVLVAQENVNKGHLSIAGYDCDHCGYEYFTEGLAFILNEDGESYSVTNIETTTNINIVIPSIYNNKPVTSIGERAFLGCSALTSITIPNSVTSIGERAFQYCSSLKSITIPDSVTSIGDRAFSKCTSLTSIVIPNSVSSISSYAFTECSALTSITIPNSVTSIGKKAFAFCSSLTSIIIPNSVTSIDEEAFCACSSLTNITIPNSVTSIGKDAFSGCSSLTSIEVDSNNKYYDSRNNCNAIIETSTNTLILGCNNTIIPENVASIGSYAFSGCSSLTNITIPNSVTSIGKDAFSGCSSLTSIEVDSNNKYYDSRNNCNAIIETSTNTLILGCNNTIIPENVTSIGEMAFYYCDSLTNIAIPSSVTSIGEMAFYYCSSLTSVAIGNGVTSIGENAFAFCSSLKTVYYAGTENQLLNVSIGWGNEALTDATIHYNYKG